MGESKEHGFRLTVQDSSLPSPIGLITGGEIALVAKCDSDDNCYLATNKLPACGDPVSGDFSPRGFYGRGHSQYRHLQNTSGTPKKTTMANPLNVVPSADALLIFYIRNPERHKSCQSYHTPPRHHGLCLFGVQLAAFYWLKFFFQYI